ncbi:MULTISPECIES: GntR family transcriptional regulator [Clostridium]|uniref:GntR family transcriptional regulator n=1 Tax=Clostridium TaxID=1485 RepID=UPI0018988D3C|nr:MULTISPECIES: GntR family transcriptional regulator [Clostridium]MDI9218726.1 GntR family transcriptional regulator [Clostridium tertium]
MLKYEQIALDLQDKILSGKYKENEQLPLEKEMCEYYNVSRITVKKAVDKLVMSGLVIKRRGAGTFVKSVDNENVNEISKSRQFAGFTNTSLCKKVTSKVLEFKVVNPSEEIAKKLKVNQSDFVYYICRVRYADNEPYVIEYTYMPIDIIIGLKMGILEKSIYEYIEKELKLKIKSAHRTIRALLPTELEQKYLEASKYTPLLEVEQIAFLDNGQPFEYSKSRHRNDKFEFKSISVR